LILKLGGSYIGMINLNKLVNYEGDNKSCKRESIAILLYPSMY